MNFVIQWMDVIWLPVAFFIVHKHQRVWVISLIISCMFMMRMQLEFISGIGYERGLMSLMNSHILHRALIVYSLFYMLFLILSYYSPHTRGIIIMAASISVFFMAFFVSTFVMLL